MPDSTGSKDDSGPVKPRKRPRSGVSDHFGKLVFNQSGEPSIDLGEFDNRIARSLSDEWGKDSNDETASARYLRIRKIATDLQENEDMLVRKQIIDFFDEGVSRLENSDFGSAAATWERAGARISAYYESLQQKYPDHKEEFEFCKTKELNLLKTEIEIAVRKV